MGILLKKIRIENFRSLQSIEVELGEINILLGQNNSGKTNFLKAVDIALNGYKNVSDADIYLSENEKLSLEKEAIIDIMVVPCDGNNNVINEFNEFWSSVFTENWITTDDTNGDFFGVRTIIKYESRRNDYSIVRKRIVEWGSNSISETKVGKKQIVTNDVWDYVNSCFMDAQRDVSTDIKNRKSYFGKVTANVSLSKEKIDELEQQLGTINTQIVSSIESLEYVSKKLGDIGHTLDNNNTTLQIEPMSRKLSDLHKGMDISFKEGRSETFSIAKHGMGTRSWIAFLTLGAYVDWMVTKNAVEDDEYYVMLTMEEPEAHLHPQAQKQLYRQLLEFKGQKIISTHSPNIVAQSDLFNIIHFYKGDGVTGVKRLDAERYVKEEKNKIRREVINSRGELLFSSAVVLCEGITEEQALSIYFEEYFGIEPYFAGIDIIGIGGQNYKSFLKLITDFNIKWFVFSDGESDTIKTVKKAVELVSDKDIGDLKNVVVLENGKDYEGYLIESGYAKCIVDAMNTVENKTEFFDDYMKKDGTSYGKKKSNKPPCEKCHQDIYEDRIRDYSGENGYFKAIYDACTDKQAKAKYASEVASTIISNSDGLDKVPSKIQMLFKELSRQLQLIPKEQYNENEIIG